MLARLMTLGLLAWTAQAQSQGLTLLGSHAVRQPIRGLAWHPDGSKFVSGSDWDLDLWDISGGTVSSLSNKAVAGGKIAYSPDGSTVAAERKSGGNSGSVTTETVQMYQTVFGGSPSPEISVPQFTAVGNSPWINWLTFSPDGATVALVDSNKRLITYNWASGTKLNEVSSCVPPYTPGSPYHIRGEYIDYSPDGNHIATCGGDGRIHVWQASDLSLVQSSSDAHADPGGGTPACNTVQYTPDGTKLVSSGLAYEVIVWDAATLSKISTITTTERNYRSDLSADGKYLATASSPVSGSSSSLTVYDLDLGTSVMTAAIPSYTMAVAFSPDMTKIVTGGGDKTVRLWSTGIPAYVAPTAAPPASPPPASGGSGVSGSAMESHVVVESGGSIIVKSGGALTIGGTA